MNKNFLKVLFSMSFFLILGKGLGFMRVAMVASTYGAGFVSDIYSFEDSLINEVYTIFASFLACSFIPKYLSLKNEERNRLFSLLLNLGSIIMTIFFIISLIFTRQMLEVLIPGYFEIYNISEIIFVTKINMIMLILTFIVNYILVVLQAHEVFVYLTLESVILNIIIIVYLFVWPKAGVLGLILCRIIAYTILLILVLIRLRKISTVKYINSFLIFDTNFVDMFKTAIPMLGVTILWQVNYIIDKSMASKLASGSIAYLHYSNTIAMIIYNVIGYVVSTYIYPIISKVQNDHNQVSLMFKKYLLILLQLVLPISVLTIFYSDYVSALLYGRGNIDRNDIVIISHILILYLPGTVAYCIKNLYSKLFYIKRDTKIVLILDVIGCVLNIILNILLVKGIGVYGLALATSISYCMTVIFQIIIANKNKYTRLLAMDLRKVVLSVILLIGIGYFSNLILTQMKLIPILEFIYVAMIYLITCILFSVKDLKKILMK